MLGKLEVRLPFHRDRYGKGFAYCGFGFLNKAVTELLERAWRERKTAVKTEEAA